MTCSLANSGDLDESTCNSRIQQLCSGIGAHLRNSQTELLSSGIEQVPALLRIVILITTWHPLNSYCACTVKPVKRKCA